MSPSGARGGGSREFSGVDAPSALHGALQPTGDADAQTHFGAPSAFVVARPVAQVSRRPLPSTAHCSPLETQTLKRI